MKSLTRRLVLGMGTRTFVACVSTLTIIVTVSASAATDQENLTKITNPSIQHETKPCATALNGASKGELASNKRSPVTRDFNGSFDENYEYLKSLVEDSQDYQSLVKRSVRKGSRLFFLGESHGENSAKALYTEIVRILKSEHPNIQYIFLEQARRESDRSPFVQEAIDSYMSGNGTYEDLTRVFNKKVWFGRHNLGTPFQELFDVAKELGLQVIAVDDYSTYALDHRNSAMSSEILSRLRTDNLDQGIMIVGSAHLTSVVSFLPGDTTGIPDLISRSGLISTRFLIRSQAGLAASDSAGEIALSELLIKSGKVSRAVGFSPKPQSPAISNQRFDWDFEKDQWDDFDGVIIAP